MKIACAQMDVRLADSAYNYAHALELIRNAAVPLSEPAHRPARRLEADPAGGAFRGGGRCRNRPPGAENAGFPGSGYPGFAGGNPRLAEKSRGGNSQNVQRQEHI